MIAGLVRLIFGENEMLDYLYFGLSGLFLIIFVIPAIYYGFRLIREKSLSNAKGAVACATLILVSSFWQWADRFFPEYHGVFLGLLFGTVIYIIGVKILVRVEPFHIRYFTQEEPINDVPVRELVAKAWVGLLALTLFGEISRLIRDFRKDATGHGPDLWHWWEGLLPLAAAVLFYQIVVRVFKLRSDREPPKIIRPSKPAKETGSGAG